MISYCGIDCSKCESYLATQADNDAARRKIADKCLVQFDVVLQPEQIHCTGCKSDGVVCEFAAAICHIRECNIIRSQPHCAVCSKYPCNRLQEIIESAPAIGKALEKLR